GAPVVDKATIPLDNGKTFTVITKGQGPKSMYVQRVKLNGVELERTHITHNELMGGGVLEFTLGPKPPKP
ncbi:MAG: glycoside hydrolase family 92 protein, partial [Flavobacteriales bacterium]|nr:glycoside hydrolase family 92 protein [Flavobacteriales bacterium]